MIMSTELVTGDDMQLSQDALFQKFLEYCRTQKLFDRGDRVLLAVSGGLDSSVLARLMSKVQRLEGIEVFVAHVDHQKRGVTSEKEGVWVKVLASQLSLSFHSLQLPSDTQGNQNAMREGRRNALESLALQLRCNKIATAHHADDNAETLLMRAISGTGIHGLRGMHPVVGQWIKPLLGIHRKEMLEYARRTHMSWVEDPSNERGAYLRNRIRNEVFPMLEDVRQAAVKNLARLGQRLDEEESEIEFWLKSQLPTSQPRMLSLAFLERYPKALSRRLLRVWLDSLGVEASPAIVEALLAGRELIHARGSFLLRSDHWVFYPENEFGRLWETPVNIEFNKLQFLGESVAWSFLRGSPLRTSPIRYSYLLSFKDPQRVSAGQIGLEWDRLPAKLIMRRSEREDMPLIEPVLLRTGVPKPYHKSWPLVVDAHNPSNIVLVVGLQAMPAYSYGGVGRCVAYESLFEQNLSARKRS